MGLGTEKKDKPRNQPNLIDDLWKQRFVKGIEDERVGVSRKGKNGAFLS